MAAPRVRIHGAHRASRRIREAERPHAPFGVPKEPNRVSPKMKTRDRCRSRVFIDTASRGPKRLVPSSETAAGYFFLLLLVFFVPADFLVCFLTLWLTVVAW